MFRLKKLGTTQCLSSLFQLFQVHQRDRKRSAQMVTCSEQLIPLANGPSVPAVVILWLTAAEERGLRFQIEPDGRLHIGPREQVQDDDLAFVRRNRDAVIACVRYVEEVQ